MHEKIDTGACLQGRQSFNQRNNDVAVCKTLADLVRKDLDRLSNLLLGLRESAVVGLACHPAPDPDAAACILGMDFLLRTKGITPVLAASAASVDEIVRLGFSEIDEISVLKDAGLDAVILLDTHDWIRAGLSSPSNLVWDNHRDISTKDNFLSTEVSAVSSIVTAAIVSDPVAHSLLNTPRGQRLAAQLMLGIATDCRYLPGIDEPLHSMTERIAGMRDADWLAFRALREHVDLAVLERIQASPVWSSSIAVLTDSLKSAESIFINSVDARVAHMGKLSDETDRLRALTADALTLFSANSEPAEVSLVTSINCTKLKLSLRLSESSRVLVRLGRDFGERLFAAIFKAAEDLGDCSPSYGVRNHTVGGGCIPLSIFENDLERAQEFISDQLRKFLSSAF